MVVMQEWPIALSMVRVPMPATTKSDPQMCLRSCQRTGRYPLMSRVRLYRRVSAEALKRRP